MARDVSATPAIPPLPKVSFQIVDDPVSTKPSGVYDPTARSYGFNDSSEFQRPDSYIRYIEPLEIDLAGQVEYDMDEQDKAWIDAVNEERGMGGADRISYETFEIMMDRLEKDWFDLTKNIPKPEFAMPSEDSTCAICDDSEGENSNAIVFCDGCNLAVHQDCYGVPYIPEGQWLCRKCTVSPESPVSCILCPNEGGAFKQTASGEWVHLLCAIWIPETRVANEVFMEPITGVDAISKPRWKLNCSICKIKEGACIQCAKPSCFTAFHATCARRDRLLLPMKAAHGAEPVTLTCYCDKHLPKEQQEARAAALASDAASQNSDSDPHHVSKFSVTNKTARAYAKTYKPGPPLVPAILVSRLGEYCKQPKRRKLEFILLLCRYWSLKREARRGAPLLKRLHLEPWTARGVGQGQSLEEKRMKLQQLKSLLSDVTRLHDLTKLVLERERQKLKQVQEIGKVLATSVLVHQKHLRTAFDRFVQQDRKEFFKNPVNKSQVPDYFEIVKQPMCWTMIEAKMDKYEYWDVQAFKDDVNLVIDNALLYNKLNTPFHRAALRLQKTAGFIFADLLRSIAHTNAAELSTHPTAVPIEQEDHDHSNPIEKAAGGEVNALAYPLEAGSSEAHENPSGDSGIVEPHDVMGNGMMPPDTKADSVETEINPIQTENNSVQTGPDPVGPVDDSTPSTASLTHLSPIGDLEPPLDLLSLLLSRESIESDIDIIVDDSPLAYLFKYELAKEKPPPTPPPPPPPKPKRDRRAEYQKKKMDKLEEKARQEKALEEILQVGGAVRGVRTRTRGAVAAAAVATSHATNEFPVPASSEGGLEEEVPEEIPSMEAEAQSSTLPSEEAPPAEDEEPASVSVSATAPRRPPYRKRQSTVPGSDNVPQVVDEVDSQQMFTMFDMGWVLRPGQKRRSGKTPMQPISAGRPLKKRRTDAGPSRLSVGSTPVSGNQILGGADALMIDGQEPGPSASTSETLSGRRESELYGLPLSARLAGRRTSETVLPPPPPPPEIQIVKTANGRIVVEELDTPATRRQKAQRKKEEKMRLAAALVATSTLQNGDGASEARGEEAPLSILTYASLIDSGEKAPPISSVSHTSPLGPGIPGGAAPESTMDNPASAVSIPSTVPSTGPDGAIQSKSLKRNEESELSELSDVETQIVNVPVVKRRGRRPKNVDPNIRVVPGPRPMRTAPLPVDDPSLDLGTVLVPEGCMLEGGTLVWAKVSTYPWWPCVVYEDDDPRVPLKVFRKFQHARSKRKDGPLYLVQFMAEETWQWVTIDKMRQFAEYPALDAEMLAEVSPRQKWKSAAQREGCKKAFEAALSQVETASEAERNEAEVEAEVEAEAEAGVPAVPAVSVEVGELVAAPDG